MLEQLGILVVDEAGVPVEFLEKVAKERIVAVLQHHKRRDVFFNAFLFGFTKDAMRLMVEMYSQPTAAKPQGKVSPFVSVRTDCKVDEFEHSFIRHH